MKHDLFISYSRKDFEEVNKFVNMLKSRIPDLDCWFDITGIESGDEFEDKIISAIDNSANVLFALSDNSLASEWTKDEVMYAKNTDKKVIPVILKGGSLKGWFLFRFGRVDCIDITNALQVDKLINNLSTWTRKPVASVKKEATATKNATETNLQNLTVAQDVSRFEVVLKSAGAAKLAVVKAVKESLGIGLKEAKDFVDSVPCSIADFVETKTATELKKIVEEVGATVSLVPQTADKAISKANKFYTDGKYAQAMELYMKVAQNGNPRAQYLVGVLYHNGKGCTTDYEEAYNWWKLAADQGYKDAVHYVGYCYEYGRGVAKNISKAKEYYSKSAAMGFEQSKESLKKLG